MYREGEVSRIVDGRVEVALLRHSACSQCGGCSMGRSETKTEKILAINEAGAKVGDYVRLHMPDNSIAAAALLAYGIPLVSMLVFMVLGSSLGFEGGVTFMFGLAGLAGSYVLNQFVLEPRRRQRRKYQVIAESIIDEENVEGEI